MTTDVPFHLPHPAYEAHTWRYEGEHGPASQTPLIASSPETPVDQEGASEEPPISVYVNGYNYVRAGAGTPFGRVDPPDSVEALTSWREEWLPQVDALVQRLETFDPMTVSRGDWESALGQLDAEYQRVNAGVHRGAVLPAHLAVNRFFSAYIERFGQDRRQDALALLQGFSNRSLDRAIALWDLSRLVRGDAALWQALDRSGHPPDGSPAARAFQDGLAALLEEFGHTTDTRLQDLPIWREDPSIPLALIKGYAQQEEDRSPGEAQLRQRDLRLRLEQEIRAHEESDPPTASLTPLMEMAQQFLPNLEDHNLLSDQRLNAASRSRWLSVGAHLAERGAFASAGDVFYYRRVELLELLEGGEPLPQTTVDERRALQETYRSLSPPRILGKPSDRPQPPLAAPVDAPEARVIRGAAASPGSYRGRARLARSLSEAASIAQGDVLVCAVTTPSWTPYFGLAGAVVTNAGGVLSHGAVVAREFGIPAVVGTRNATSRIPNGATITVDGTAGVVVVEVD